MPRIAVTTPVVMVLACLAPLPAAGVAHAGPLGFSDPVSLGSGPAVTTAAALSSRGAAVVAYSGREEGGSAIHATTRDGAAAPWRAPLTVTLAASAVRELGAAIGPGDRLLLTWAEQSRSLGARVRVVEVTGGRLRFLLDRPVANSFSAAPRLAVTRLGRVQLAWRDGTQSTTARLKVATLGPGAKRMGPSRTLARGVGSVAITASGSASTVAWVGAPPGARGPRTLWSRRLRNSGVPREPALLVSHDAAPDIHLAGGSGERTIVSFVRPGRGARPAAAFTRALQPTVRPARPLVVADGAPVSRAAAIAGGPDERFLAAAISTSIVPVFGFRITAWRSRFGGVWVAPRLLVDRPSPMLGRPRVVMTADGTGHVVFAQARGDATSGSGPTYDVRVAPAQPGQTPAVPVTVASGLQTVDGRGISAASAGNRVLIAWPGAGGGVMVTER